MARLQHFFGGPDEAFFYLITTEIEARGGVALEHIWEAQQLAYAILGNASDAAKVC